MYGRGFGATTAHFFNFLKIILSTALHRILY